MVVLFFFFIYQHSKSCNKKPSAKKNVNTMPIITRKFNCNYIGHFTTQVSLLANDQNRPTNIVILFWTHLNRIALKWQVHCAICSMAKLF